jgi:hypothetical protein
MVQEEVVMSSTDPLRQITPETIKQALDPLRSPLRPLPPSPLQGLHLVGVFLDQRNLPTSPLARQFALEQVLTGLIASQYTTLLARLELPPVTLDTCLTQARACITVCGHKGNPELTGCSWLYWCYVQPELLISRADFARLNHITGRSLQRYQILALERLAFALIETEWRCRLLPSVGQAGILTVSA